MILQIGEYGALAQLGERLICIQEVRSSILLGSTIYLSIRSLSTFGFLTVRLDAASSEALTSYREKSINTV